MPYVKAQQWKDINTRLKTAEERVVELESQPEVEEEVQPEIRKREKWTKFRGGSCYGLNGWDVQIDYAFDIAKSDIKVYPDRGYNYKIVDWTYDPSNDRLDFKVLSLSPKATITWPRQMRKLNMRGNDLTGPDDPELTKP